METTTWGLDLLLVAWGLCSFLFLFRDKLDNFYRGGESHCTYKSMLQSGHERPALRIQGIAYCLLVQNHYNANIYVLHRCLHPCLSNIRAYNPSLKILNAHYEFMSGTSS